MMIEPAPWMKAFTDAAQPCPRCAGTGRVKVTPACESVSAQGMVVVEACSACQGRGTR